jgi:hypothetical protein
MSNILTGGFQVSNALYARWRTGDNIVELDPRAPLQAFLTTYVTEKAVQKKDNIHIRLTAELNP